MTSQRALLLTDVVDSTALAQALGDAAMAPLWAAHDRAARDLLPLWRGREIDKSDGLLLLFDSAADAVGYALAYHHALAALGLPFKARAGLHVGAISLRENSAADIALGAKPVEVEGLAKPVAARVMAAALGGQTLLTLEARIALGPTALRLQSHGQWRLQGLPDPVELFEIGAIDDPAAPFTPPPDQGKAYRVVRQGELWLPVRQIPHSLPAERNSFVGRQAPLRSLARKLDGGARLVSVLGIGGTGKTRLVTRFAWTWLGEFPGGVWFCDLSQARSVDAICCAVAQALDVPLDRTDPLLQVGRALAGRGHCLVILDNFEQVARFAEETLGRWLDRAAQATFIVTTREVLGIVGEDTLALAPLPASDAAALFERRAESAGQSVPPGPEDQAAIAQLVEVLDGLPLAIELAAARVRVMPPRTLLARMNERFMLLRSSAGRHDRQATLRAAFDWSWELLGTAEKAALAQLSVFEGGFTLASVEAVLDLSASDDAPPWIVDLLQWLVDKSFVRQVAGDRFDLLESVREYAAEHLRTAGRYPGSGEAAAIAAQARHWTHFAGLDERAAVARRCIEAGNLAAACRRAAAQRDTAAAVAALSGAWATLRLTGPFGVGADLAALVRELPGLSAAQLARVEWVTGSALEMLGNVAAASACFDAGLALAVAAGDRPGEARLLAAIGAQCAALGQREPALQRLSRALDLARALGDRSLQCSILNSLGRLADEHGQHAQAHGHYDSALALARSLGDRRMEGGLLGNLGGLHHDQGRLDEARRLYEQALALADEVGDRRWAGNAHCNLGLIHHEQGRTELARSQFETALALARAVGHARLECTALCNLGLVFEAQGELDSARTNYEKSVAGARDLADRRSEGQFSGYLGALYARLGRFDDARRCLAAGEALLLGVADRLSLGLLLCQRAAAERMAGDAGAAEAALAQAEQLSRDLGQAPDSEFARRLRELQPPAAAGLTARR